MNTTCPFCQIRISFRDPDPTPCCKYGAMLEDGFSVSDAAKLKVADEVTEYVLSLLDDYILSIPEKAKEIEVKVDVPF